MIIPYYIMQKDAGMFLIPVITISQQDFGSHGSYAKHVFFMFFFHTHQGTNKP